MKFQTQTILMLCSFLPYTLNNNYYVNGNLIKFLKLYQIILREMIDITMYENTNNVTR